MKTIAFLSLLGLFAVAGCRTAHLGDDHGRTYRAAFKKQQSPGKEQPAAMDDDDSKNTLEKHRSDDDKGNGPGKGLLGSGGL